MGNELGLFLQLNRLTGIFSHSFVNIPLIPNMTYYFSLIAYFGAFVCIFLKIVLGGGM